MLSELKASDWVALAIAGISFLVSLWTLAIQRRDNNDKELLGQLVLTLERAFSAIQSSSQGLGVRRDRLAWLTAARHLVTYNDLRIQLKTNICKRLCEEHEEFWRHQFYLATHEIDSANFFFSSVNADELRDESIDATSAAIILAFSDWPKGKVDPLEKISFEKIVVDYGLLSPKFRHFREYIKKQFPETFKRLQG